MSTLRYAINVPLALVAGVAIGSNPRWFADMASKPEPPKMSPVEAIRAREPKVQDLAPPPGREGAESPELRALRLAEEQLFEDLEREGLSFHDTDDLQTMVNADGFLDGLNPPSFPIASHPAVERYLKFFSSSPKGREIFSTWLKRSGKYREIIAQALREQGLPGDLEAVAFVESGFWPTAKSSAGAVGLWQFMPATARAYGLTVTSTYDERRSPWRASEAAAAHLRDLYNRFNSWDLALAAYNFGYQNVERRLNEAQIEDFWSIVDEEGILPEETRKYVPKVQAVALLLNNLDHFGFDAANLDDALRAAAFEVPPGTTMSALARASGTTTAAIRHMNPEFLTEIVPDRGAPVVVHIPRSGLARARVMLPRMLGGALREIEGADSPFFNFGVEDEGQQRLMATAVNRATQRRQVDNLDWSGGKEEVQDEARETRRENNSPAVATLDRSLPSMNEEEATCSGEKAMSEDLGYTPIPQTAADESKVTVQAGEGAFSRESALALAFLSYRVSRGDSLDELSKRFGVSIRELQFDNKIRDRSVIYRGQTLKIRDKKQNPDRKVLQYKVRPGDSLGKIAARLQESERRLVEINQIKNPNLIRIGQIVQIPPS